jgi:hypothetical protein
MGSPDADRFRTLHAAFLNGDMETLRRELGSLEGFPSHRCTRLSNCCSTTAQMWVSPGFLGKTAADLADEQGHKRLATFIRSRAGAGG